jgi:hypothetical protein
VTENTDLFQWLKEVINDSISIEDILAPSKKLGFMPQLIVQDGQIVTIKNIPRTVIKRKYQLISKVMPNYYDENIRFIRKLEQFLDVPFLRSLMLKKDKGYSNILENSSCINFNQNTKEITYEEDYTLYALEQNDYNVIDVKHPDFFNCLDDILTLRYIGDLVDKKFSELNNKELDMIKIYHYK